MTKVNQNRPIPPGGSRIIRETSAAHLQAARYRRISTSGPCRSSCGEVVKISWLTDSGPAFCPSGPDGFLHRLARCFMVCAAYLTRRVHPPNRVPSLGGRFDPVEGPLSFCDETDQYRLLSVLITYGEKLSPSVVINEVLRT
jgi:hypothetical protein